MKIEVTASPSKEDEAYVIAQTRAYNEAFMPNDVKSLSVFARAEDGRIVGGLTGKTYWNYLDVSFLWVHEKYRGAGHATALIAAAECEALNRGCSNVLLDTFSFQALGFYKKLGYTEFGCLSGFAGGHERHYLHKSLAKEAANKRVSRPAKTHALTRRQVRTRSEFNVKRKDSYQKEIRLAISAPTIVRND